MKLLGRAWVLQEHPYIFLDVVSQLNVNGCDEDADSSTASSKIVRLSERSHLAAYKLPHRRLHKGRKALPVMWQASRHVHGFQGMISDTAQKPALCRPAKIRASFCSNGALPHVSKTHTMHNNLKPHLAARGESDKPAAYQQDFSEDEPEWHTTRQNKRATAQQRSALSVFHGSQKQHAGRRGVAARSERPNDQLATAKPPEEPQKSGCERLCTSATQGANQAGPRRNVPSPTRRRSGRLESP